MLSHLNGVTSYGWRVSELRGVAHRHDHGGGRLPAPVRVQVAGLPPWEDARQNAEYETVTAALELHWMP